MTSRNNCAAFILLSAVCAPPAAQSAPAPLMAWAPQPVKSAPFTAPNKPLKTLVDILARHKGKTDWSGTEG